MNAYKVNNEPILRIVTNRPMIVDGIVDGLPGASVWAKNKHPNHGYFFWVRCPDHEVTTALGHFLRSVNLDEIAEVD